MVRKQLFRMLRGGDACRRNKQPHGGGAGGDAPPDNALRDKDHLCHQLLEYEKGQTITVFGYKRNSCKTILSYLGVLLSLGVLRLVFHWFPRFWVLCTHDRTDFKTCQRLLIEDNYRGQWTIYATVPIKVLSLESGAQQVYYLQNNKLKEKEKVSSFTYKSIIFVLEGDKFQPLSGLSDGLANNVLHSFPGLSASERLSRLNVYGPNEIKVPMTPILQLVLLEIVTPFYVFQIASLTLWIIEYYYYFVVVIIILTVIGVGGHVYQTRQNESNLRKKVIAKNKIVIYERLVGSRNLTPINACSTELVPGDLVQLKEGYVYCDTVLLSGTCLVDESMLTGESIQVLKTPIPNNSNHYNFEDSAPHMLFAGTRIVQVNSELKALVINTGFLTSKGSLIRSIMYPPPMDYAFDRDCNKFCFLLFLVGVAAAIRIALTKSQRGIPLGDLIIKTLDSITVLLPAALPATLTIAKLYALRNLKKKKILCTNSKVMAGCGSIDVVCLDKTGTITEDNLDFIGIVNHGQKDIQCGCFSQTVEEGMAVCHNLATYEGTLQGDHLEVQMFKAAGGHVLEGDDLVSLGSGEVLKVLERYQFSSNLRRMSVIIQRDTSIDHQIFCKGSPEIIKALCKNPQDISEDDLLKLTRQGYRVISLATRRLSGVSLAELKTLTREEIEKDLSFLGYLVFENKLKPGSKAVIEELRQGNLSIKMITGDNIETAISVAKECGILPSQDSIKVLTSLPNTGLSDNFKNIVMGYDHLAVTGTVWSQIMSLLSKDKALLKITLPKIQVFARMASNQKQQIVEQFQSLGLNVCMCGDGANDCSALKIANVGISLTESESSIASHLTSKVQNISAVLDIVREGRSALVTTISMFKILLTSNIIQYVSLLLLYEVDASYADLQFLWLDLHMLFYGFFIGYVDAHEGTLSGTPPTKSLLSWKPNISIIGQCIPIIGYQMLILHMVRSQSWFVSYVHDTAIGNDFRSYENYVIYIFVLFQYTTLGVVYSRGKPHRKPMWTNWTLCICMLIFFCIDLSLTLSDVEWLNDAFALMVPPDHAFRWKILDLALAHFVTAILIEEVLVEGLLGRYVFDGRSRHQKEKLLPEGHV